jgi:predicted MFS family arabinose efflux permease
MAAGLRSFRGALPRHHLALGGGFLQRAAGSDGPQAGRRPGRPFGLGGEPISGLTVAEALRQPTFWLLCFIIAGISACVVGTTLHLVPLLTDRGMSGRSAALVVSVFGIATIIGRGLNGLLMDLWFAPRVMAIFLIGAAAGLIIFWRGAGGGATYGAALLLGLGLGAETDIMPYLVSRYFGLRAMGTLFGGVFGFHVLGAAAGGYLLGFGFDATGSYRLPLGIAAGVLVLTAGATLALGPYERALPSRRTESVFDPMKS